MRKVVYGTFMLIHKNLVAVSWIYEPVPGDQIIVLKFAKLVILVCMKHVSFCVVLDAGAYKCKVSFGGVDVVAAAPVHTAERERVVYHVENDHLE